MTKKKGLGRGLEALMGDADQGFGPAGGLLELPIEAIYFNPLQPRSEVRGKDLEGLIESIRDKGVLEPLLVRARGSGEYELIAGERRLRAAQAAGLRTVPVVVREATPAEMLELALVENLLREDLNPMEEAEAYDRLAREFGRTQEETARLAGKDRSTVANLLRLLNLPEPVQEDVRRGRLTVGHARALLALVNPEQILKVREEVLARGLSVRETEKLVKKAMRPAAVRRNPSKDREDEVYFQKIAETMSRNLQTKVKIFRKGHRGKVEISFHTFSDLERIMDFMGVDSV